MTSINENKQNRPPGPFPGEAVCSQLFFFQPMNLLSQQDALQQEEEQEQPPAACQAIDQKGRLFTLRLRSFIGHGRLGRLFHGEMNRQRKGVWILRCDGERSREIAGYSVTG